jgi:uncharacterized protein (DUF1778 family)
MPEEEYYLDKERVRSFVDTVDEAAETNEEIPALSRTSTIRSATC